jgi:hypothetical protein
VGQEQELKWRIQDELRKVPMKAPVKTLVWDLLSRARVADAVIPEAHTPSLTELEGSACLGRSTVTTYLRALEATGWVVRERPSIADSLGHGQRTQYRLAVGSFDLPPVIKHEKHTRKPRKDSVVSAGSGADLGQELNHGRSGDDLTRDAETGHESSGDDLPRNGARSGDDLELGQEMTCTRSGDDLNKEPLTEVLSSSVHQGSSLAPDGAVDAPPLPGFETTEKAPAKPKRAHRRPYGNADFDEFFEAYPRNDDPKKAWGAWQTALKAVKPEHQADLIAEIIAGAERYRDDPNRTDQFTKHATTWLNAGSWENGPLPARNNRSASAPDNRAVSSAEDLANGWDPARKGRTQ